MNFNILGFGLMGKQIASLLYLLGYHINIYNRSVIQEKDFMRHLKLLKRRLSAVNEGTYEFYDQISSLPNCPTIESVIEELSIKKKVYDEIRQNNDKLFCSNTSSYSPTEIAPDVVGLHFFNPISLGLVEVVESDDNSEELSSLVEKLRDLGFQIVNVYGNRGYIGNYILFHEISSALKLVEKFGYGSSQLNQVYSKLYDGRDIFVIIDLIGIDIVWKILVNLHEKDNSIYMPEILSKALEKGILGRKNKTTIKSLIDEL